MARIATVPATSAPVREMQQQVVWYQPSFERRVARQRGADLLAVRQMTRRGRLTAATTAAMMLQETKMADLPWAATDDVVDKRLAESKPA